jgi:hypothetical protein
MSTFTIPQIYGLARGVGLDPTSAVVATCVALAESKGVTDAIGDVALEDAKWGPSVGLWQIRSLRAQKGTGGVRDEVALLNPAKNAESMKSISNGGASFDAWTTYKNGAAAKQAQTVLQQVAPVEKAVSSQSVMSRFGDAVGQAVDAAASALNPFAGWQDSAASIGLKLLATGCALALFVVGAKRAVDHDSKENA